MFYEDDVKLYMLMIIRRVYTTIQNQLGLKNAISKRLQLGYF